MWFEQPVSSLEGQRQHRHTARLQASTLEKHGLPADITLERGLCPTTALRRHGGRQAAGEYHIASLRQHR